MKKILIFILAISLLLTFTACSSKVSIYEPNADWIEEYKKAELLSDAELNYFQKDFLIGYPSGASFREYVINNDIELRTYGDVIEFEEGKQLENGDYVLITENKTINFAPIAIRLRIIDEKSVEIIDVVSATRIIQE